MLFLNPNLVKIQEVRDQHRLHLCLPDRKYSINYYNLSPGHLRSLCVKETQSSALSPRRTEDTFKMRSSWPSSFIFSARSTPSSRISRSAKFGIEPLRFKPLKLLKIYSFNIPLPHLQQSNMKQKTVVSVTALQRPLSITSQTTSSTVQWRPETPNNTSPNGSSRLALPPTLEGNLILAMLIRPPWPEN